jgi:hypothetical protein
VTLRLVDGVVLHLDLAAPDRRRLAVVHAVSASQGGRWLVRGATPSGDLLVFHAERLRVERG